MTVVRGGGHLSDSSPPASPLPTTCSHRWRCHIQHLQPMLLHRVAGSCAGGRWHAARPEDVIEGRLTPVAGAYGHARAARSTAAGGACQTGDGGGALSCSVSGQHGFLPHHHHRRLQPADRLPAGPGRARVQQGATLRGQADVCRRTQRP